MKWAQSDKGKKSIAKNVAKWRQSDEGKKSIAKRQTKIKQRKHTQRQKLIVQQTASLRASSSGSADARLCVARGDVLAATLAADGGSGGRSSLCFRQHEGMIDHTKPGGVKDLALNVLKTHHADQHVEALGKEAGGSTGSPSMSSSVLQPMAANEVVDALLCPALQRAPVTVHQSQIEAASRLVAAGTALPVDVNVCTPIADLLPMLVQPAIVTALTAVYGAFPADRVLQLDLLRAAVELRHDPGAGLGLVGRSCGSSDRGGYMLGEARSDGNIGPPATERDRLRGLWQIAARSIEAAIDASLEGGAGCDGIPLAVREFLTDGSMYGTQHASCCAFHAEQRLRVLAFLHFWRIGPATRDAPLRREVEWYASCDQVGTRPGCSRGAATFVARSMHGKSWASPKLGIYHARAGTVMFSCRNTLLSIGLGGSH